MPFGYRNPLKQLIKQHIREKYPGYKIKVKYTYKHFRASSINIYFIISDPRLKVWDGIRLSQKIRNCESQALIILATTKIDHTAFFRSHVGFFEVIDMKQINLQAIEDCLKDCLELSQK